MKSKKIISSLIAAAMMMGLIPGLVFADGPAAPGDLPVPEAPDEISIEDQDAEEVLGELVAEGDWGTDGEWYVYDDGSLHIKGNGYMDDYTGSFEVPWSDYMDSVTSIIIDDDVDGIGAYAFWGFTNVTEIKINYYSDLEGIGEHAFSLCSSLETFVVPEHVEYVGTGVFEDCDSLTDVYCFASRTTWGNPGFCDGDPVVFHAVEKYKDEYVGVFDGKNCTVVGDMYENPAGLTAGWEYDEETETLYIKGSGDMFDCDDYMPWEYCYDAKSIVIEDGITSIGSKAFYYFDCVTDVTIPEGVTRIGKYAFYECEDLVSLIIPDSVTTIDEGAFCYCYDINTVEFGPDSQLTTIGDYAFYYCYYLNTLNIPDSVVTIGEYAFYECSSLYVVGFGIDSQLKTIGEGAFSYCYCLYYINIPENVIYIGEDAFYYNDYLIDVFCYADPDVLEWDLNGNYISGSKSTEIHVNADDLDAFEENFPDIDAVFVGDIDSDVCGDDATWNFDLETKTLTISGTGRTYGYNDDVSYLYYQYVGSIENLVIEEGIESIGYYSFWGLINLKEITLADSVEKLDEGAFDELPKLERINISPDSQLQTIEDYAFSNDYCLSSITIPSGVTYVGYSVFNNAYSLTDVYCFADPAELDWKDSNGFMANAETRFHVPYGYTDAFSHHITVNATIVDDIGFVNVADCENGTVTAPYFALAGDEVALNIIPDENYSVADITIIDSEGNPVDYVEDGYTFVYPEAAEVTVTVTFEQTVANGWLQDGMSWFYYEDGEAVTGWKQISSKWYYFNEDGIMQTGWVKDGTKWYYFTSGGSMVTGWKQISGKWYYFNAGGSMATGWKQINSKWFYFNGGGDMVTGWKKISGKFYYFNTSGVMQTGWVKDGTTWYYLNDSGVMQTGWVKISGKYYYFNGSGAMQTGWLKLDGKWYYLNSSGVMVTGTQTIDGKKYTFSSSGVLL